jgi:putative acetyltransferase
VRQVRPARPADAGTVLALHVAAIRAFGPEAYDDEQVEAWAAPSDGASGYPIDEPGEHCVVVERDGALVGVGHLTDDAEGYEADRAVEAVYVHPDHTRRGVGSALLAHLEGYTRGTGADTLELWASLNAVEFYEAVGWERTEERTRRTGGVELTVVVTGKSL